MSDWTPHSGAFGERLVDMLLEHLRTSERPPLNEQGTPVAETLAALAAKKQGDVPWEDGQLFGLVHDGGPSARAAGEQAAMLFLHENMLNPLAFPSLSEISEEITQWTARLLHGPEGTCGFVTSGGTESIMCAVLAAREHGRQRGIERGTIVVPESAHPAFHKAAYLLDMAIITTALDARYAADIDAMAAAVDERTVLVVGSAPQYPQGAIDPIPQIAALAQRWGASCHVDACMGGHVLPFAERNGRPVPSWDFRVEGVDSISADNHKLGYAPKGVSTVLYRSPERAARQVWDLEWSGGYYATLTLLGSRSAAPMAAAWAVMRHVGLEGYDRLVDVVLTNCDRMRAAVNAIDGLRILGEPIANSSRSRATSPRSSRCRSCRSRGP